MYGEYPSPPAPGVEEKVREAKELTAQLTIAATVGISAREDLIPAPEEPGFDEASTSWFFRAFGSTRFPRLVLGTFRLTLKNNGDLVSTLE